MGSNLLIADFGLIEVLKGATGLYKHVGGAGASFCIFSNMLHISDTFFKLFTTNLEMNFAGI